MKQILSLSVVALLLFCGVDGQTLTVTISPSSGPLCNGGNDGYATANPTGGTPPYTYAWAPCGQTTQTATGLSAGGYTVTVTDAALNQVMDSVVLTQPTPFVVSFNITCIPGNATVAAIPSGGISPYTYSWYPPDQNLNPLTGASPGTHTIIFYDSNACSDTATVQVPNSTGPTLTTGTIVPSGCNVSSGSITTNVSGGTPPYLYSWNSSPSQNTSTANGLPFGFYQCLLTDANGCNASTSGSVGDSCNYVWPGDANEDAVADNNDILAIGIANSATGTTRANATVNWIGQPSANWAQTFANGTNYKFADCDGDGTIANADTNAVILNFGFTHNMRLTGNPHYNSSLPDLSATMNQDSLGANTWGTLSVALGNSSVQANNVYGVAFTLNFDPSQIDAASFRMNENGSWMGTAGNNLMGVVLNSGTGTGSVQVALTRYDHNNANGFGNIAQMGFMTTNALTGTGNSQEVHFTISNVNVIDANEISQQVNAVNDSVVVADPAILSVQNLSGVNSLSAFPNPFTDATTLQWKGLPNGTPVDLVITDVTGRTIFRKNKISENQFQLQRNDLSAGMYFCSVITENKIIGQIKIVVQ